MTGRSRLPLQGCRLFGGVLLCGAVAALAQTSGQQAPAQEITSQESQPTFKLQTERNLVLVRVVVRDTHGQPVPKLRQQDFQLFDSGKPQTISVFSVEEPASKPAGGQAAEEREVDFEPPPGETETAGAHRFLALFFDDQHIAWEDLTRTQQAASRFLASSLQPDDRVGIFTSSGQNVVDFTDDHEKIKQTLLLLRNRPFTPREEHACPDILDYQAYKMIYEHDIQAVTAGTLEAYACQYSNITAANATQLQQLMAQSQQAAETAAFHVMSLSETEAESSLRGLEELVRRMGVLPGERNIVLISPGFLTDTMKPRWTAVVDRAIRENVIINTFDSRGLYTVDPAGDISKTPRVASLDPQVLAEKTLIMHEALFHVTEVLSDTAQATGGVFFHNSNNLDEGFRKVGALPQVYYVLGFTPSRLKYDGSFHPIKVSLTAHGPYSLQARHGYYAPRTPPDSAAKAKEDLQEAAFSHDEIHELPIYVNTQFFKFNDTDARLSVLTRVDVRLVRFRKEQGRNLNNLTFLTVLFDRDGKYLTSKQKTVDFHLLDTSLEKLGASGLTSRASFDLKPGTYMVRQVVRDTEGGQISALNRTVEIPY